MQLKTKRLVLRKPKISDIDAIIENINNYNISKWLSTVSYPYKRKDALSWISIVNKNALKKKKSDYTFAIYLKENNQPIGGCGVHNINFDAKKASVGYWLGEKNHKKGYGTEALSSLLNFAFNDLLLNKLEAEVFIGNIASANLLEKFGFTKEGTKRQSVYCKADNLIKDEHLYGLLKKDYKPLK